MQKPKCQATWRRCVGVADEREQRDFVRSAKKGAIAKNLFICT
ncbi:hypothetical protein N0Y54_30030 [Nostoc punctiforme UO1]